jgi:hypothetical protein
MMTGSSANCQLRTLIEVLAPFSTRAGGAGPTTLGHHVAGPRRGRGEGLPSSANAWSDWGADLLE